ncbi:MAG: hemolysin III family protein [Candidatus Nanopelagicales bacterium]|nr:hemolysin III family protein [Candidatus Nanopelagicales bacterium]MDZ4249324.1 hemolysin III family protein [Candidatus Nanopelagicales bacterium]
MTATHTELRPALRGWLHATAAPIAATTGTALVAFAPVHRFASSIYAVAATALFSVSAVYNRGRWSGMAMAVLSRLDHSMIFFIIAASYTPVAMVVLPTDSARLLLILVWTSAGIGTLFRVAWFAAPRWLYTPLYVVTGWALVPFLGQLNANPAGMAFIAISGLCYTSGAVVYGLRRPDPVPHIFGFHELFHALTIGGWALHYVGLWLVVVPM